VTFLGDAPKAGEQVFIGATPERNAADAQRFELKLLLARLNLVVYRKPEAKGWGETFGGRPVKLISEKP
jgi:hypothetical protein